MILLAARGAAAGDGEAAPDAPPPEHWVDRWHEDRIRNFDDMAESLDRMLGAGDPAPGRARAEVRATGIGTIGGDESPVRGQFGGRLTLPRTARHFQLLFDDRRPERDEDPFQDPLHPDALGSRPGAEPDVRRRSYRLTYGLRTSLSTRPTFGPYIKGRRRAGAWLQEPSMLVYWRRTEGFGVRVRFDHARSFDGGVRLNLVPQATWSEATEGVEFQQGASVSRPLGRAARIGLDLVATVSTLGEPALDNGHIALRYRRRAWRDWCFVELSPRADFPRETRYEFTPSLQARLEILFCR